MPSCPLTGVCFDETYLEEIKKSIASGDTLKEAFDSLATVASRLMEEEAKHMSSTANAAATLPTLPTTGAAMISG
jgi:hypothetical protein